eukprot:scaffold97771_cov27-Tisochrysis_lutea.AAC.1
MRAAVDHVPEPVKPAPQSGECVQGGGGGGGEEGGGGKLREGAGSTDGGGQREEQEPGVRRQPQQLQQPLMLSHGLGGPQARAESTAWACSWLGHVPGIGHWAYFRQAQGTGHVCQSSTFGGVLNQRIGARRLGDVSLTAVQLANV